MNHGRISILALAAMLGVSAHARAQQVVSLSQTNTPVGSVFQWVGPQANALAGSTLFRADMNGDINRLDLLVGAPGSGSAAQGQVFVEFIGPPRSGNLSLSNVDVIATGENTGDQFGKGIGAGFILTQDVAGALYQDLVVGAPNANGGAGAVYLFPAPKTTGVTLSSSSARLKIVGQSGDRLGDAISVADLNGDTYGDIIIAAPGTGRIYVVWGASTLSGTIDLSSPQPSNPGLPGGTGVTYFSVGVSGAIALATADFNRDGFRDLAVGVPSANGSAGAVAVVKGRSGGFGASSAAVPVSISSVATSIIGGAAPGDHAGTTVTTADFDGDRYPDLIVGAPDASPASRTLAGAAYVFWGGTGFAPGGTVTNANVTIVGAAGAHLATAISAGFIRRDQQNDLALLAPGASASGDIDVIYGGIRSSLPSTIDAATGGNRVVRGDPGGAPLGSALVLDVSGEGADDILAAAPTATALGNADAGVIYNVYSPTLWPSPMTTSVSAAQGSTRTVSVDITNIGSTSLRWAARSNSPWLSISPASGVTSAASPASITLTVAPGNLPANVTYTGGFSIVSTDPDLVWSAAGGVNLTVTPGVVTSGTPGPSGNPPGVTPSPDEGSPSGVYTAAGTNVTVTPVTGIVVTFASVSAPGYTKVDVRKAAETATALDAWSAWDFFITTDAGYSGPVTIGIVYDSSVASTRRGLVRIVNNGQPLSTVRFDPVNNYVVANANGLPVLVNVENDLRTDINGDGFGDLVWANDNGLLAATLLTNGNLAGVTMLTPGSFDDPNSRIVGIADFNSDGSPDVVWQNSVTGQVGVWYMSGASMISSDTLSFLPPDPSWHVVAVADFDGDEKPDLLWRNQVTNQLGVTFLDGVQLRSVSLLNPDVIGDSSWKIVGAADFDGDGNTDILWWNRNTGMVGVTFMNGVNLASIAMLNAPNVSDTTWEPVTIVDLNADGHPDIVWQNRVSLAVGAFFMNGVTAQSIGLIGPGASVPAGWHVAGGK